MDLKTRAIRSTAWYATTRVGTQVFSWGVTVLIARLLTPQDYGLFAMALGVITFLELFQEFGLGVAIVQRQDLSRQQLNAVFWIVATASGVLVLAAFLGSAFAAWFFREPRLEWMVRLLALTFLLNALGLVPYNLLTKEIDFRRRSLAEGCGVVLAAAVSLTLAYDGYGVWALVLGHLVRSAVRNVAMSLFCGWLPGVAVSFDGMSRVMKFGLQVAGSNVVGTVADAVKTAIMGRFLGGHFLGLLTMGHTLGIDSAHKLYTSVVNQLSLPLFSKLQRDHEELRRYFLAISRYLAVVCLPVQAGIALVASDLVAVLLSEQWRPVVGLLRIFAIGGIFYVLPLPSAPAITARGKGNVLFRFSCVTAGASVVATLIGAPFGLPGVVAAWCVTFPTQRLYLLGLSLAELHLPVRRYLETLAPFLLSMLAMVVVVTMVRAFLPWSDGAVQHLVRDAAFGAATYGAALHLLDRRIAAEVKQMVHGLFAASRA